MKTQPTPQGRTDRAWMYLVRDAIARGVRLDVTAILALADHESRGLLHLGCERET